MRGGGVGKKEEECSERIGVSRRNDSSQGIEG
jgi:hypothetical protein